MRRIATLLATTSALALGLIGAAPAMADQDLCSGASSNGVESVAWDIFYNSTSQAVVLNATGQGSRFVVFVTLTSSHQTFSVNALPFLNAGDTVLAGPGSVLGFTSPVPASLVPAPPAKGQAPAYTCGAGWTP